MIRKACAQDYSKLADLWLKVSLDAHDFIPENYWRSMHKSVLRDYFPNAETYVFEDKHQLKGFISLMENNYIGALFVASQYQRQKIGKKLLTYVRRHRSHLNLNVFTKNAQAIRFYQREDFKIVNEQTEESTKEKELQMSWAVGCKSGFTKRFQGDS